MELDKEISAQLKLLTGKFKLSNQLNSVLKATKIKLNLHLREPTARVNLKVPSLSTIQKSNLWTSNKRELVSNHPTSNLTNSNYLIKNSSKVFSNTAI